MNKRDNPYTPGAGRKPATMAGRDGDLEHFEDLVERLSSGRYERSLIYSGLRGVGKTCLLMEFDVMAGEAGWATTDVVEIGGHPDLRLTFARMASRLLRKMSRIDGLGPAVDGALPVVKAFSAAGPSGVGIKLDVVAATGVADSGDPEEDLTELLVTIGEVARDARTGTLFLLDEMHNFDAAGLAAVCIAFQAISRRSLPVALVGAGLPDLQTRLMAAKPYADRLFQYRELGRLNDPAARAALIGPAAGLGVDYDERAARAVVTEAAGYPYFIQEYGLELWNYAEATPITTADVDTVRELVSDTLAGSFFGPRFEMATDAEQRYLAAMASLDAPPYRSPDVAQRYGAKDQRGVSVHRDALIGKGLIWSPRRGLVDFTVPLFAEFLRAAHPLTSFEE